MIPAVSSSFDIASWFLEQSKKHRSYLSPLKIQRVLYLAQAFYAGNNDGRALMPSVFVVSEVGPIEPNLFRVFEHEPPTVSVRDLEPEIEQFLDSIWEKYGGRPVDALSRLVTLDPAYQEAEAGGIGSVIELEMMERHFGQIDEAPDQVVDGKRVRPWTPKIVGGLQA